MGRVKERKELFGLLSAVVSNNRDYYSRYGVWNYPQIKVFWIEVNTKLLPSFPNGLERVDKDLYELSYKDHTYWIDTHDSRIWEIITFAPTNKTNSMIRNVFLKLKGIDRLWFTEKFMRSIQKNMGYDDRGFGIKFRDILTEGNEYSSFSAKFWIGKSSPEKQIEFLKNAQTSFSMSNIRFGKSKEVEHEVLSSELYELSYNGHITITTSDDIENVFNVISTIEERYKKNLLFLEREAKKKPVVVEVTFTDLIKLQSFNAITAYGNRNLRLWLHPYEIDGELHRYSGVDLHTGDFIYLDLAESYSYISAGKDACMNVAPRFGTLSSRYLSSNSELFYDGVELFA